MDEQAGRFFALCRQGLYQLLKEMDSNPTAEHPYTHQEIYHAFILVNRTISGLVGSLQDALVYAGVAASKQEFKYCLATAEYKSKLGATAEAAPHLVPMIGIVGAISSGKGTVGEMLEKKFGGLHLPLSDRLRAVSLGRGGDETFSRDALRQIDGEMKPVYGKDVFVRWTVEMTQRQAAQQNKPLVSMDGFRSVEEAVSFQNQGGVLIYVHADDEVRFDRLVKRGRYGDDGRADFEKSDAIEKGWIVPIRGKCNFEIDNSGDEASLEKQVMEVMEKVKATL